MKRFATAEHLASYSGTTPRVHSSGDKTRYGHLRQDVNRYLKWAFIEAANGVCLNRRCYPYRHVSRLYEGSRAARKPGRTELRTARLGVRRPHSRNSSRLLPSGRRSSPVRKTEDGRAIHVRFPGLSWDSLGIDKAWAICTLTSRFP